MVENYSIEGALAKFGRKKTFLGLYRPLNYFSHAPSNLYCHKAWFKCPYDYILDHYFLPKEVAKLVKTQVHNFIFGLDKCSES